MEKECKGYTVSDDGRVWKNGKEIICNPNKDGYCVVSYFSNKKRGKKIRVHRLVWEAFNGKIPKNMEIDHINRIRNDNRLSNLRCVTHKTNMNNPLTIEHIKSKAKIGNICFGNEPKKVEQYINGVLVNKYESINNACLCNKISWWDIYDSNRTNLIVNGFTYKILE